MVGDRIVSEGPKGSVETRARRSPRARLKGVAAIAKRHTRATGSSSFLSLAKLAPLVSGIPCLQFPGVNQPSQAATGWDRRTPIYAARERSDTKGRREKGNRHLFSLHSP